MSSFFIYIYIFCFFCFGLWSWTSLYSRLCLYPAMDNKNYSWIAPNKSSTEFLHLYPVTHCTLHMWSSWLLTQSLLSHLPGNQLNINYKAGVHASLSLCFQYYSTLTWVKKNIFSYPFDFPSTLKSHFGLNFIFCFYYIRYTHPIFLSLSNWVKEVKRPISSPSTWIRFISLFYLKFQWLMFLFMLY